MGEKLCRSFLNEWKFWHHFWFVSLWQHSLFPWQCFLSDHRLTEQIYCSGPSAGWCRLLRFQYLPPLWPGELGTALRRYQWLSAISVCSLKSGISSSICGPSNSNSPQSSYSKLTSSAILFVNKRIRARICDSAKILKKYLMLLNRGIDTVEITALSNQKPGILNNYIRIIMLIIYRNAIKMRVWLYLFAYSNLSAI